MKQINLKLSIGKTALSKLVTQLLGPAFTYKAWKAHAQLHLSRVGLCDLHKEIFSPTEKYWEFRQDNRNFKKRKTNQKERPD